MCQKGHSGISMKFCFQITAEKTNAKNGTNQETVCPTTIKCREGTTHLADTNSNEGDRIHYS